MENSTFNLVTLAIAAGGLFLGIANSISDFLRRRHRANVVFWNYLDGVGRVGIAVTVENSGHTTFTVTTIGIQLKGGKAITLPVEHRHELPKVLHPGEYCEVVFPRGSYLDAGRGNVKHVFARLPTGKEFHSKRLTDKFIGVH